MRIRAFQDKYVANELVIRRFCKCQEIENKKRDQYKEVVFTFSMKLMAKLADVNLN